MDTYMITRRLKHLALAASTALLAACGGGVDVSIGGTYNPGPGLASVTDPQALKVTSASIAGGPMTLLIPANVLLSAVDGLRSVNGYQTRFLDISSACTAVGGRLSLSVTDADATRTLTGGDLVSLSFTNCAASNDGVGLILNGGLDMSVTTAVRATDTIVYMTFTPRNLSASTRGIAATYSGSITIETIVPVNPAAPVSSAYVTNLLEVSLAPGRTDRISNARWGYVDDVAAGVVRLTPNQNVTLFENGIATAFSVASTVPLAFRSTDGLLVAGELSILHPADTLRSRVSGLGQLEIAIDYNSGGLYDRFLNINALDLLNGWN